MLLFRVVVIIFIGSPCTATISSLNASLRLAFICIRSRTCPDYSGDIRIAASCFLFVEDYEERSESLS